MFRAGFRPVDALSRIPLKVPFHEITGGALGL
jgi:hypothetical protein